MSDRAPVTTITAADQLIERVSALWPRRKLTEMQAQSVLARMRQYGLTALLDAINVFHMENPDSDRPVWSEIEQIVRRALRPAVRHEEDGANYIRHWWQSWNVKDKHGKSLMPAWAAEILACDEQARNVRLCDFEAWNEAQLLWTDYAFYCLRASWPTEEEAAKGIRYVKAEPGTPEKCVVVMDGERMVAVRDTRPSRASRQKRIEALHLRVRNLPTFGPDTEQQKNDWLSVVERDARDGGLTLAHVVHHEEIDPF